MILYNCIIIFIYEYIVNPGEDSKSIEDLLIDELHKPITPFIETIKEIISNQVFNRKKCMSVLLEEIQPKKRNIDVYLLYNFSLLSLHYKT